MNPQMRLVIMLAVLGASGSLLFAAEPAAPPADDADKTEKVDKVDKAKGAQAANKPLGAPEQGTDEKSKTDAAAEEDKDPEAKRASTDAAPEEDKDPQAKRTPTAADKAGSPQRFTPSEQVRADFDVSFPVDI